METAKQRLERSLISLSEDTVVSDAQDSLIRYLLLEKTAQLSEAGYIVGSRLCNSALW